MKTTYSLAVVVLLLIGTVVAHGTVLAATLSLQPKMATPRANKPYTVRLVLDSVNRSVNSAEATVTFPIQLLKLKSVSTKNSIFVLWAKKPVGSNKAGTIVFAAGKKNPGFKGKNATVLQLTFVGKRSGTATVKITKAKTLANDGKGTNVLQKVVAGTYRIR